MQVFKFGGASIKDAAGVRNVAAILRAYAGEPLVIIVSAMAKPLTHLRRLWPHMRSKTGKRENYTKPSNSATTN